jgi:hypothetical protein
MVKVYEKLPVSICLTVLTRNYFDLCCGSENISFGSGSATLNYGSESRRPIKITYGSLEANYLRIHQFRIHNTAIDKKNNVYKFFSYTSNFEKT